MWTLFSTTVALTWIILNAVIIVPILFDWLEEVIALWRKR